MKQVTYVLFAVLVLSALCSEINALAPIATNGNMENCQGQSDRRCPLKMCGPDGPKGWKQQDNSKPLPGCCGGPIC